MKGVFCDQVKCEIVMTFIDNKDKLVRKEGSESFW